MDRLRSRPDLVPLASMEQGPGRPIHGNDKAARMHLVGITYTTSLALMDTVVGKTAQHKRLGRCLADAGWSNAELHHFIVGHTGVMGMDNAQALLDLGVPSSKVQPAMDAIAIMGCKYLCEMLKAYWRKPADVLSPLQMRPIMLLCICKTHSMGPLGGHHHACCTWPLGARIRGAARRPARQKSPKHGAARKRQPPLPSVHVCMPNLILVHYCLFTCV